MALRQEITIKEVKSICEFLNVDFDKLSMTCDSTYQISFYEDGRRVFIFKQICANGLQVVVPKDFGYDAYNMDMLLDTIQLLRNK